MEWLSDDPTFVAVGLVAAAAALLVALKVTQQGKYLIAAAAVLGLAVVVVLVEWLWVTDTERIEETVYGLARAVGAGDVPGALAYLDDDVRYTRGNVTLLNNSATRALASDLISHAKFDFVRVNQFRAAAGGQSRRGTADFRVLASGSIDRSGTQLNFASTNTAWSFGLREVKPGVWKVNRITPVELPRGESFLPR